MISLISHFFMGLSEAQVHFEDVQSTFGIREVNLRPSVQCRSTNVSTTGSVRSVVVPAPLDQIDPAEAGLHQEPAEASGTFGNLELPRNSKTLYNHSLGSLNRGICAHLWI